MNIHKHMEAIFVGALAIAGAATIAIDSLPRAEARPAAQAAQAAPALPAARNIATPGSMAVVIVRGHKPAPHP
jgi:hypothetical protein